MGKFVFETSEKFLAKSLKLTWLNKDLANSDVSHFWEFSLTPVSKVMLERMPIYLENIQFSN